MTRGCFNSETARIFKSILMMESMMKTQIAPKLPLRIYNIAPSSGEEELFWNTVIWSLMATIPSSSKPVVSIRSDKK